MLVCLLDHRAGDNLVAIGFHGGGLGGLLALKGFQSGRKVVQVIQAVLSRRGGLRGRRGYRLGGNGCIRLRRGHCRLSFGRGCGFWLCGNFRCNFGCGRGFHGGFRHGSYLDYRSHRLGWGIGVQR